MRTIRFAIYLLLGLPLGLAAASYTNSTSGLFTAGSTWIGGVAPSATGDAWNIVSNTVVVYNTLATNQWGASSIAAGGELRMTNGVPCRFIMVGNLSGAGKWMVGSPANPIDFTSSNTPGVTIEFKGTAVTTLAGTNNLGFYGVGSHRGDSYLAADALSGTNVFTVSNVPPGCASGDVIAMGNAALIGRYCDYYIVQSVAGNNLTVKTVLGYETNYWPNQTFRTNTPALRMAGSYLSFLSCPIEIYETTRRTGSRTLFTECISNTLSGVLVDNTGYYICVSCHGWLATNVVVNNVSGGALSIYGNDWTVVDGSSINIVFGLGRSGTNWLARRMFIRGCQSGFSYNNSVNWNVSDMMVDNCTMGGLAYSSCSGWTVNRVSVSASDQGGLANSSCQGWIVDNVMLNNCKYGGLCYNCNGWIVNNATVANSGGTGALAYYNCYGFIVNNVTVNNCQPGALGWSCSGWQVANVTNTGLNQLFNLSFGITAVNANSSGDTLPIGANYFPPIEFDDAWIFATGTTKTTNGVMTHSIGVDGVPIGCQLTQTVRPNAKRTVCFTVQPVSNVTYTASFDPGGWAATPTITVPPAAGGQWTNLFLTYVNENPWPVTVQAVLNATGPAGAQGFSRFQAGADTTTAVQ